MNSIALVENNMLSLEPVLTDILPPQLPFARFKQLVLSNFERTPKLVQCTPQSVTHSVITHAVLGLEPDGVTGNAFLIPYKVKRVMTCNAQIGYKGYGTMADRSAWTLDGVLIRKNDLFIHRPASQVDLITHEPAGLSDQERGPIVGAYAIAKHLHRAQRAVVMSIEEIYKIRDKSPSYKFGTESLWRNPDSLPAMVRKTPVRALGGIMPVRSLMMAAAMETQQELGHSSYITVDKQVMVGDSAVDLPGQDESQTGEQGMRDITPPVYAICRTSDRTKFDDFTSADVWLSAIKKIVDENEPDRVSKFYELNKHNINFARLNGAEAEADQAMECIDRKRGTETND